MQNQIPLTMSKPIQKLQKTGHLTTVRRYQVAGPVHHQKKLQVPPGPSESCDGLERPPSRTNTNNTKGSRRDPAADRLILLEVHRYDSRKSERNKKPSNHDERKQGQSGLEESRSTRCQTLRRHFDEQHGHVQRLRKRSLHRRCGRQVPQEARALGQCAQKSFMGEGPCRCRCERSFRLVSLLVATMKFFLSAVEEDFQDNVSTKCERASHLAINSFFVTGLLTMELIFFAIGSSPWHPLV